MKSTVAFALVGSAVILIPPAAGADELKAGDKWLECWVGKGGHEGPESLFEAVVKALDAGDRDALSALGMDRCAYFRKATLSGWHDAENGYEAVRDLDAERVRDMHARLQVEKVRLAQNLQSVVKLFSEGEPAPISIESTTSPMHVSFEVAVVDRRWYLAGMPVLVGGGEPVIARAKTLLDSLGGALAKHTKRPATANKVLASWWKKNGAELDLVVRALRTIDTEWMREEYAKLKEGLADRIGKLSADPGINEQLGSLLPPIIGPIGVAECDRYFADFQRCVDAMPEAARATMLEAMKQSADAMRTATKTPEVREGLASACKAARDAFLQAMTPICPDLVFEP